MRRGQSGLLRACASSFKERAWSSPCWAKIDGGEAGGEEGTVCGSVWCLVVLRCETSAVVEGEGRVGALEREKDLDSFAPRGIRTCRSYSRAVAFVSALQEKLDCSLKLLLHLSCRVPPSLSSHNDPSSGCEPLVATGPDEVSLKPNGTSTQKQIQ